MAGRGPAPKGTRSRERDQAELAVVVPDDEVRGADLPDAYEWPVATEAWWRTWRESAQAKTFTPTDWDFLLDTAMLHAEFWLGDKSVASELRLRVAKFGATPEDRARLKIAVGDPAPAPRPRMQKSKAAAGRKDRLLKAVPGGG
jgi:hypothetical protein